MSAGHIHCRFVAVAVADVVKTGAVPVILVDGVDDYAVVRCLELCIVDFDVESVFNDAVSLGDGIVDDCAVIVARSDFVDPPVSVHGDDVDGFPAEIHFFGKIVEIF